MLSGSGSQCFTVHEVARMDSDVWLKSFAEFLEESHSIFVTLVTV
jgi:hypothetical protein